MTKPAVIAGVYTDARFYAGLKVLRVSVEVPIEKAQEFFSAFGTPDKANPVSIVLARMQKGLKALDEGPVDQSVDHRTLTAKAEGSSPSGSSKLKRSNRAALLCKDEQFQIWLCREYNEIWNDLGNNFTSTEYHAGAVLKELLNVKSRADLDTNEVAGKAWDSLETSYRYKDQVR